MTKSYQYTHVKTNTTTLVKTGAGKLHTLTINTAANGAISVYDGLTASGTELALIKASTAEQTFVYDVTFFTGLCIVTAAATDITVSWE